MSSASAALPSVPLAPASAPLGSVASQALPIDGAALFERYCALCHKKDGTGYGADNAPSLVSRTFLESASDAFIAKGIRVGRPGTAMGAYLRRLGGPLEEAEIQAIVRFLRSKGGKTVRLDPVDSAADADQGATLYEQRCVSCHGTEAQRGKAPMLFNAEFLSAATGPFLRHAIAKGRPPTEMPAFAPMLSDRDIDSLVVFLQSKRPGYQPPRAEVDLSALAALPVVIHPGGRPPNFTLRENRFVSIDQVKKALDEKRRIVLIDARAASDFALGHIPGAIPNPYYDKAALERIPNDGTWVVAYCACPHHASGEVVDELRRRGHANTAVLDEGILEWQKRGYPMAQWQGAAPGKK